MNEAHKIIVKQVVYDEFIKQIRTVRHSFNTTGTANYRVQLAVPPSTNNNYNKYTKRIRNFQLEYIGTIVDWKKVLE